MIRVLVRLLAVVGLCAAGALPAAPALAQDGPLVLAAASLQESMSAAADRWAAKGHPHPVLSFAASSALARQIEARAPADLFVSADEDWMDDVARAGLVAQGTRVSFLVNALVIAAPAGNRVKLYPAPGFPLLRALGTGRLAMADPDAVPAGRYGKAALTAMGVWARSSHAWRGPKACAGRSRWWRAAPRRWASSMPPMPAPILRCASPGSSRRQPCADHLSARAADHLDHPDAEAFRRFLISAKARRSSAASASWRTERAGAAMLLSAGEWGVVALSAKVSAVAILGPCRWLSRWPGCWRAGGLPGGFCSTGSCICRWCCRRW
jgi:molybdate transport system substrate-binding protein